MPKTTHGNKHILVVDHFTKWCEAFATPDQKVSTVAPLLINRIFSRFGLPAILHSDQGRNFESVLMHEICDSMGITKTRTTAYHPQCDGQTERQNRTLQNMLSSFVSNRRDDWDLWLDSITFAYNTSKHDVLGVSPYEVVFGRAPRLPLELELGMPLSNPTTRIEYMHTLRSVFHDVRQIAKQQLTKVSEKRAGHKQKTNTWRPFREGQTLGSPMINGIDGSCVTLPATLLIRAVQFDARSACDASMFTSCIYIFLRKIYIHDVNIDASQADRALNWTARINKVADRVTQE